MQLDRDRDRKAFTLAIQTDSKFNIISFKIDRQLDRDIDRQLDRDIDSQIDR